MAAELPSWASVLDGMDPETARAIMDAQLADLDVIAYEDASSDAELARRLMERDMEQEEAWHDAQAGRYTADDFVEDDNHEGLVELASREGQIVSAIHPPTASPPAIGECVVCTEQCVRPYCFKFNACEHFYCKECLRGLVRSAMTNRPFHSPGCCNSPLLVSRFRHLLGDRLVDEFEQKEEELQDPTPSYCHNVPACETYIPAANKANGIASCPRCSSTTCITCGGPSHTGDCPRDEATQQVIDMATTAGWKQCPQCHSMVELSMGCYHMTCHCSSEWCYLCLAEWTAGEDGRLHQNCDCPLFDEHNVQRQAAAVAQRENVPIDRIIEHLRFDHDGEFQGWERQEGRRPCDGCGDRMDQYTYRCAHCNVRYCYRCRFNRGYIVQRNPQLEAEGEGGAVEPEGEGAGAENGWN